jgi:hypothetical protein
MHELDVVARQLRRHALRRQSGVPTVSAFVGDVAATAALLESSLARDGVRVQRTTAGQLADAAGVWVEAAGEVNDLMAAALEHATGQVGALASWHARSAVERQLWLAQLAGTNERTTAAAAWLARRAAGPRENERDSLEDLVGLASWLPTRRWPALCVMVDRSPALQVLTDLALAVPSLPLAAVLHRDIWEAGLAEATPRARALLLEGQIEIVPMVASTSPTPSRGSARSGRVGAAVDTPSSGPALPGLQVLRRLARNAHDEARYATSRSPQEAEAAGSRARSLAELLLYELLESELTTRGMFALNGVMAFSFGNRPAEIDLVSTALTLAIEVDGYHHFTEATAYRRDRRKDVLLQTEGYWVMRVLASDVVERETETLDAVKEFVSKRRRGSRVGGGHA